MKRALLVLGLALVVMVLPAVGNATVIDVNVYAVGSTPPPGTRSTTLAPTSAGSPSSRGTSSSRNWEPLRCRSSRKVSMGDRRHPASESVMRCQSTATLWGS
jgi:hypothetical protein